MKVKEKTNRIRPVLPGWTIFRRMAVLSWVVAVAIGLYALGGVGSTALADHCFEINGVCTPASGDIPGAQSYVSLSPAAETGHPVTWWCDDRLEAGTSAANDGVVSCHMRNENLSPPYDEGLATDVGAIPGGSFVQPGGVIENDKVIRSTTYAEMVVAKNPDTGTNYTILNATVAGDSRRQGQRIRIRSRGTYNLLVISDGCASGCATGPGGGAFAVSAYDPADLAFDLVELANTSFATPYIGWKSTIDIDQAGAAGAFAVKVPADHTYVLNPPSSPILTGVVVIGGHPLPFINTPLFCCGMGGTGYKS